MSKPAERRTGKLQARRPARFPRQSKSDDERQREMLKLWLYASLKLRQLAGGPDVGSQDGTQDGTPEWPHVGLRDGPPASGQRRLRRGTA